MIALSTVANAAIITETYSLTYENYEFYGFELDETEIGNELPSITSDP